MLKLGIGGGRLIYGWLEGALRVAGAMAHEDPLAECMRHFARAVRS